MTILKALGLFFITALAEIIGCYTFFLWYKLDKTALYLIPSAVSLALFAWLLTLHPDAAGRTYAAYGGVYVFSAILWLWLVDHQIPTVRDLIGRALVIVGSLVILSSAKIIST